MRRCHVGWSVALALLAASSSLSAQQTGTVSGRVSDASSGEPVADVRVTVEGTTLGTSTGADGAYTIARVPSGTRAIVARRLGFAASRQQVAVPVDAAVTANFSLRAAAVTLGEVVVTGVAAPTAKRELGNTVETVAGEEVSEAPGATAIDQALQGKVIGAVISENSGQPGGGVSIRLRGTNSILGGAEPLYVIDGVIVDNSSEALVSLGANAGRGGAALSNRLADIDPADVDRIEVLKGAAAAALYGSRANNGVIQIFTKRGQSGDPRITFTSSYSTAKTPERYALNMAPTATFADVAATPGVTLGAPVQRYDIQDQIFRRAQGTSNRIGISGGGDVTTYFVGGSYDEEEGILRTTDYQRLSVRANLSQQVRSNFEVGVRSNFIRTRAHFIPEGEQTQGVLTSVVFTPTTFNPAFNETLGRFPYNPILQVNPLNVLENFEAPEEVTRFLGGVEGTWRPGYNITLRYLAGIDDYRREAKYLQPPRSTSPTFTGLIQNPVLFSRLFNNDLTASHVWSPTPALGLNTSLGFRYTSDRTETIRAAAGDLPPEQTLVGGATQTASQGLTELRTVGWYVEERVSIAERLYLTGGINWDASSAFGTGERRQMFPRLGVSYLLGEEPFWQQGPGNFVSSLRLRAAYGETGGQPPGLYSRFENYINVAFGGQPGLIASTTAGNPDLKPERQREIEGGFDAGFFADRAHVEFTYYDKKTKDLVLSVPLQPSSGFQVQFQNIGELSNKGVEIGLNTVNVDQPNFGWRSRLTYAANRNRIEKLVTSADTLLFDYLNAVIEGEQIGVFYGGVYARNPDGTIAYGNVTSGGVTYRLPLRGTDTLPDGRVVNQARIIGDPNPDFTASFSNEFTLPGNLELSILLDGRFGNDVANFTRRITEFFGSDKILELEASGDTVARTFGRNPAGRISIYEEYIEDGSYVKLREIALKWLVDQRFARAIGADGATIRIAGRNLYTWTDYRGLDPEVNLFSANTVSRGVDFATTPLPRQFSFSVSLNY